MDCQALRKLLTEFSLKELWKMVSEITSGYEGNMHEGKDLYDLIKHSGAGYTFNTCTDYAYSYEINFDRCCLIACECQVVFGFGQIRDGIEFLPNDNGENESYLREQLGDTDELRAILTSM